MNKPRAATLVFVACGLVTAGFYYALGHILSTRVTDMPAYVALCMGAFVLQVYAFFLAPKLPRKSLVAVMFFFAVVFRLLLVPVEGDPYLPDNDAWRYMWDGAVTGAGLNPYERAPKEIQVALAQRHLDVEVSEDLEPWVDLAERAPWDRVLSHVTFPDVKTIYGPVSQFAFAAAGKIRPGSLVAWKSILLAFEIGTMVLLWRLLRALERPLHHVLIYAWSPVAIEGFAYSGHHDSIAVFFVVAGLWAWVKGRHVGAGALLGAAVSAKLFPLFLVPLLARRGKVRFAAAFAIAALLLYAPFLGAGMDLFAGTRKFAAAWDFNPGLWSLMRMAVGEAAARSLAAAVPVGLGILFFFRPGKSLQDAWLRALTVLGVLLLLSPVANPWYLSWLLPFLCLCSCLPLWLWTGTVFLHDLFFLHDRYPVWVRPVEYIPIVVGFLAWLFMAWRRGGEKGEKGWVG